mgnify:FL=1
MALEHLYAPTRIGPVEVRNRIVMSSHTVLYGEGYLLSDRHIAYYRERALGGSGLIIAEGGSVHPESRGAFINSISAYDERCIPHYAKLAEACHEHGAKVFTQLFSLGVHMHGTYDVDNWVPLWGPSTVPSIRDREVPLAMEEEHFRILREGFARSAANVERAGLDGAELHAAHSYLLGTFLSPAYNQRTDAYGGSPANRVRLVLECAEAVRGATGPGFALGVRFSFDEWLGPHGITQDDAGEMVEIMSASGLFDFLDVSGGGYHSMFRAVAPMTVEEGHLVEMGARVKEIAAGRCQTMVVGRITTVELAEQVLAQGAADLVCMTRAHMADAQLARKGAEGRSRETVRCIGANECMWIEGNRITCAVNPVMGREREWGEGTLAAADPVKRVVVVGGGPAGMRAAAVAARRGHQVTLLEAGEELGGHLRLIGGLPTRGGWLQAIANLRVPLEVEGVDVRLGVRADAAVLDALAPDAVVCATGSSWRGTGFSPLRPDRRGIPGAEAAFVLDVGEAVRRVLADPNALAGHVVIYDESGQYLPFGLADLLSAAGAAVAVLTPHPSAGEVLAATNEMPYLFPRLVERGVEITAQRTLERIGAGGELEVLLPWGAGSETRAADWVVLSQYREADGALFAAVRDRYPEVHRIGDCVAPRRSGVAIYEGERVGRLL